MKKVVMVLLLVLLSACNENTVVKLYGGTMTLKKPDPEWQFINITWKESSIWALWYEPKSNKCYFKEDAPLGMMNGTVVIEDCRPAAGKPAAVP